MQYAQSYIAKAQIPSFTLGVGGYTLSFNDIQIADAQIPHADINLDGQQSGAYVSVQGINFTLVFTFTIQEQRYPYLSDSGNGTILLKDTQLLGNVFCQPSTSCEGTLEISMTQFSLLINQLNVTLDSPNSYIYNGILGMITDELKDVFNSLLQQPIYQALAQVANNGLGNSSTASHIQFTYNENGYPALDERYYAIDVHDQYFDSKIAGLSCWVDGYEKHCSGTYDNQTYSQMPQSTTNDGMQYYWHSGAFQSQLDMIYNRNMDPQQNSSKSCDNLQFVKTGVTFSCYVQLDDQQQTIANIDYYGQIVPTIYQKGPTLQLIGFKLQAQKALNNTYNLDEQILMDSLNKQLDNTTMAITNGNYVNANDCYYVQWSLEWSEFACNFDGSFI